MTRRSFFRGLALPAARIPTAVLPTAVLGVERISGYLCVTRTARSMAGVWRKGYAFVTSSRALPVLVEDLERVMARD